MTRGARRHCPGLGRGVPIYATGELAKRTPEPTRAPVQRQRGPASCARRPRTPATICTLATRRRHRRRGAVQRPRHRRRRRAGERCRARRARSLDAGARAAAAQRSCRRSARRCASAWRRPSGTPTRPPADRQTAASPASRRDMGATAARGPSGSRGLRARARRADRRAAQRRHPRRRRAARLRRPGLGQDADADRADRAPARQRPRAAAGDPRADVHRPRRRGDARAARRARRPATAPPASPSRRSIRWARGSCARTQHAFGRSSAFSIYDAERPAAASSATCCGDDRRAAGEAGEELAEGGRSTQIASAKSRLWSPGGVRARAQRRRDARAARDAVGARRARAARAATRLTSPTSSRTASAAARATPPVREQLAPRAGATSSSTSSRTPTPRSSRCSRRLAGPSGGAPHGSLVVAGDDDQLLYRLARGGASRTCSTSAARIRAPRELVLRRNYRCRPEILDGRDALHRPQHAAPPKALLADAPAGGELSTSRVSPTITQEAAVLDAADRRADRGAAPTRARSSCCAARCATPSRCNTP